MAKVSYTFRLFAVDQTDFWNIPDTPLDGAPAFGTFIICEGEATHICSLTPSTRADFLENRFRYDYADEAAHAQAGDLMDESGGEWTSYFGFVDCKAARDYVSAPLRVTIDTREIDIDPEEYREVLERALRFESPQKAHATARYRCASAAAWEEAREDFQSNSPAIPVVDDDAAYERHRRRRLMEAARYAARYESNLFRAAGVDLPLTFAP
jgi:hypothetical protein